MLIDFNTIPSALIHQMNGGNGDILARMYCDDKYRIIPTRIMPGSSIGLHQQTSGDDINYIISGVGKAVCDGHEEHLTAGCCHICPKNSEHTIMNIGEDELIMLTIVVMK